MHLLFFNSKKLCKAPVKMIGSDKTSTSNPSSDFSRLLRDARELVMQCRAAPRLGTGTYDELMVPPLQRGMEQIREASADLAASASVIPSSRGYMTCF